MKSGNKIPIPEFCLLGFSEEPEFQPFLFGLFSKMYLVTVFGNLLIILATTTDSQLHTPMYFFISNLSFTNICFISTTIPKMLVNIQTQSNFCVSISYTGCLTQMYFFTLYAVMEDFLLAMMAYDCFVAVRHALQYMIIINPRLCGLLVLGSWIRSALNFFLQISVILQLSFCIHLEIPHFFCDNNQIVQFASSDTLISYIVIYITTGLLGVGPLTGIPFFYSKIASSVCAISIAQGKYKAFFTRVSHLSVVSLFYCTVLGVYFSSAAIHNTNSNAVDSVMYTVVTPMLNPFFFSLRNKDITRALKTFFGRLY